MAQGDNYCYIRKRNAISMLKIYTVVQLQSCVMCHRCVTPIQIPHTSYVGELNS